MFEDYGDRVRVGRLSWMGVLVSASIEALTGAERGACQGDFDSGVPSPIPHWGADVSSLVILGSSRR